ncbi:MAG: hypothetical protein U1E45_12930 [Geminicoccaceae bacterium]
MATFTVTTAADVVNASDGKLSLREAVAQANATAGADTIVFSSAIESAGATLTLSQGELAVTSDITIDGDSNDDGFTVELSTNFQGRVFHATGAATDLVLRDLVISSSGFTPGSALPGAADCGGAVLVQSGSLAVQNVAFAANVAGVGSLGGGAILADTARVSIDDARFVGNSATVGGAVRLYSAQATIEDSRFSGNGSYQLQTGSGGAIYASDSDTTLSRTSLTGNIANRGGALAHFNGHTTIVDSAIAGNTATTTEYAKGGGVYAVAGSLAVLGTTVTGNTVSGTVTVGGGLHLGSIDTTIENSIVAGNRLGALYSAAADIRGAVSLSNGHNIFGTTVTGSIAGDLQNVAANLLFAAIDPATGGGLVGRNGAVALLAAIANPALGGADPFANAVDQTGGARPLPAGSLPDAGALERNFALSTTASANNDLLTGNGSANAISGLAGHDYIKGLGGNDTLNGGDGGDLLDGGTGNDKLNGNAGIDIVTYASGTTAVVVDLSGATDTAKRGTETDTLTGIEGAIGSTKADTFKGDANANWFMGGPGKDTFTGGGGHDFFDFNSTADSLVGVGNRDIVKDFAPGTDDIDLMGIDADANVAGNQAFHFVGTAALTGPEQVGYFTSGGNTIIRASTDADATAEIEIQLTGIKTLTAADFYL